VLSDKGPVDVFLIDGPSTGPGRKSTTPNKSGASLKDPVTPFAIPATPSRLDQSSGGRSDPMLNSVNSTPNTSLSSLFKLDDSGSKSRDLESPSTRGRGSASKNRSPLVTEPFNSYVFGMAETEGISDLYGEEQFGTQTR